MFGKKQKSPAPVNPLFESNDYVLVVNQPTASYSSGPSPSIQKKSTPEENIDRKSSQNISASLFLEILF